MEPHVFRCSCGWSGLGEHLVNGTDCANCGKRLGGDNTQAGLPAMPRAAHGFGLGRLPAIDPRDANFQMALALAAKGIDPSGEKLTTAQTSKMWTAGKVLDQGDTPRCVAYAWSGFLEASPVRTKSGGLPILAGYPSLPFTDGLYFEAQKVDEWPGEDYDGTSVRAGAKVLRGLGRIGSYVWANNAETLRTHVLTVGPAVIGINWYEDMFDADEEGKRPLNVSGGIAGGHALLVLGYSRQETAFRLLNSWGESWGAKGRAWLTFSDMQQLLRDEDGEACSATEIAL